MRALTFTSFGLGVVLCAAMAPFAAWMVILLDPARGPLPTMGIASLVVFAALLAAVSLMLPRATTAVGCGLGVCVGLVLTVYFSVPTWYTHLIGLYLLFAPLPPAFTAAGGAALVLGRRSKRLAQKRRAPDAAA